MHAFDVLYDSYRHVWQWTVAGPVEVRRREPSGEIDVGRHVITRTRTHRSRAARIAPPVAGGIEYLRRDVVVQNSDCFSGNVVSVGKVADSWRGVRKSSVSGTCETDASHKVAGNGVARDGRVGSAIFEMDTDFKIVMVVVVADDDIIGVVRDVHAIISVGDVIVLGHDTRCQGIVEEDPGATRPAKAVVQGADDVACGIAANAMYEENSIGYGCSDGHAFRTDESVFLVVGREAGTLCLDTFSCPVVYF